MMEDPEQRYYINPYIGLVQSIFNQRDELANASHTLLRQLEMRLGEHPHESSDSDDWSIYTGSSGIIFMYWHLTSIGAIKMTPHISKRLDIFVDQVSSKEILKGKRFTFLTGDAGPIVLSMLISKDPKQREKLKMILLDLLKFVFSEKGRDENVTPNELLYGRVGYLHALCFLNEKCGNNPLDDRIIHTSLISQLVSRILEDGWKNRRQRGPPLHFEWHGKQYLGAAHGYAGILYVLLKMKEYMNPEDCKRVKDTVDWLLGQRFPSKNIPSSVGSNKDKLVHFCHGAPGSIYVFLESAKIYEEEKYLKAALECGEVIWSRGILKTSYSICHGVAGNAYSLMALYKHTKDEIWLKRSCLFARWCFQWGSRVTRVPDRPNSLFEGLGGIIYMLHEFFAYFVNSHLPQFPAFELE